LTRACQLPTMNTENTVKGRPGLKVLRKNAGLTQLQLAVKVSVDPTAVRAWENSGAVPSFEKAVSLAKTLKVSLKQLAIEFGLDVSGIPDDSGGDEM